MPNNFRKIPDVNGYFISKDGDDGTAVQYTGANLEAARNAPRKTIPSGTVKSIIGAGMYKITTDLTGGAHLVADGKVVIYGDGTFDFLGDSSQYRIEGIEIIKMRSLTSNVAFSTSTARATFYKCKIGCPNVWRPGTNGSTLLKECVVNYDGDDLFYFGQTGNPSNIGTPSLNNVSIENTFNCNARCQTGSGGQPVLILSQNAFLRDFTINSLTYAGVTKCSFSGEINVGASNYASFSDPDLTTDHSSFTESASENFELTQSVEDCFNNVEQGDFSLKKTSQLIKSTHNVGKYPWMRAKYAGKDPELTLGVGLNVTPANSAVGSTNIRVAGGQDYTRLEPDWIAVDEDNPGNEWEIGIVDLINQTSFDSDLSTTQPDNENVPITNEYADGAAGANPRRLTFEIRTSSKTTKPTQDSDADNSFIIAAGSFINHEFNFEKLEFDNLQRSKGDPDFDETLERLIVRCAWFQLRVPLQDKI